MSTKAAFERVFVINLDRRPDRLAKFHRMTQTADWPLVQPTRRSGVDGRRCRPPQWWRQGAGAWGCYRSHLNVLEECLNRGIGSALILEDDADWIGGAATDLHTFLEHLPSGWQDDSMLYFGGQHLQTDRHPPQRLNEHVLRAFNVNRTHAYAVFGSMVPRLYRFLQDSQSWPEGHHLDHRLGSLHESLDCPVYTPPQWFFGQDEGVSNVAGGRQGRRGWRLPGGASQGPHRPRGE